MGREALQTELLDVQDDLRDVFLDARDRRELLVDVADLDARDGGTLERREHDPPERVAERDAVAGLEGSGLVLGVRPDFLDGLDLRVLEFDHERGLPRVVLDHELLVEIERHLVAAGHVSDGPGQVDGIDGEPLRRVVRAERLLGGLERLAIAARFADLHLVARLELVRRDVRRDAVDGEVAVPDELAGLGPGRGEAHPEDDVVEAQLERAEEVLAGDAGMGGGHPEVVPELALEHAVDAADLLLLAELQAVLAHLAAANAVLTGRRRAPLERALLRIAARALQIELGAFPAAEPADRCGVTGHAFLTLLRPGAAWVRGSRCAGWG